MGQVHSRSSLEPQHDLTSSHFLLKKHFSFAALNLTHGNCANSPDSFSSNPFCNGKLLQDDDLPYPLDITPAFQLVSPETYDHIDKQKKYDLPGYEEHIDRIQLRHVLFRYVWQGNFSSPLDEELKRGIRVLDIGCGSGSWVLDMSAQYPNSSFIGIDMCSDYFPSKDLPSNVHFQKLNVLDGLPFADGEFDFVHSRFLVQYLTELQWNEFIKELIRVTRSKGWIELMEMDMIFHNAGPHSTKLQDSTINYFQNQGIQAVISTSLQTYLRSTDAFTLINYDHRSSPLGRWAGRLGVYTLIYFSLAYKNMMRVLPKYMNINEDEYCVLLERFRGECELFGTLMDTFRICCEKK
ncbi:2308_t:CDS:2 [Acaulospora morrowiae]|uniref:2308_t:CDS:1 n=1 Tax=Acaulospora morrowiae TaxID=94023 RepID=A0A9N8W0T5_9GLOM|nr:2308_t:CDS:2 [Acaulospora morrowiae]